MKKLLFNKAQVLRYISWSLRLLVAFILLQTLFYKFTAHPDSVHIFEKAHMEPWGRITVGILECIVSLLLLIPRTVWIGGIGGLVIMGGAVFFHITNLGIVIQDDGGQLFTMALTVFVSSVLILTIHRDEVGASIFRKPYHSRN